MFLIYDFDMTSLFSYDSNNLYVDGHLHFKQSSNGVVTLPIHDLLNNIMELD